MIYLQVGYLPPKDLWNKTVKAAVTNLHIDSRRQRMLSDPDFILFNTINAGRPLFAIWKFPSNIHEIELCKFVVKLWSLPTLPLAVCTMCGSCFFNVFQHISTVCLGTVALRDAWWNTVIEDFDISLSAELCGLCPQDLYLFLLGSRLLSVTVSYHNERSLHILNFRFLRDAAAWYYRHLKFTL